MSNVQAAQDAGKKPEPVGPSTKTEAFDPMTVGGKGIAEAFASSIDFATVLQADMLVAITNILNQITKQGVEIGKDMQADLDKIVAEMNDPKNKDKLQQLQTEYTTKHDFWTNEQTQNGSQRDRYTQLMSSLNQQVYNFYQGVGSLNSIYSTLSHLMA